MASITTPGKADKPGLSVQTTTTQLTSKSSNDTLASDLLPSAAEKRTPRPSDVSTPSSAVRGNPFDTDIEAIITTSHQSSNTKCSQYEADNDCRVWPGQDHWKQKAKAAKRRNRRNCSCLSHLSKRNRIIAKVLIALLIIGIAVGIGVGISKPLGAGIWHSN
jgi:hypothetical protein